MWPEDKDLELIFKEGSTKHDHSYDPAAWDQMSIMLDKQRRRKILLWVLGAAFALFAGGYTTYSLLNDVSNQNIVTSEQHNLSTDSSSDIVSSPISVSENSYKNSNEELLETANNNVIISSTNTIDIVNNNQASIKSSATSKTRDSSAATNRTNSTKRFADTQNSVTDDNNVNKAVTNNAILVQQNNTSEQLTNVNLEANNNYQVAGNLEIVTAPAITPEIQKQANISSVSNIGILPILPFLTEIEVSQQPSLLEMTEFTDPIKPKRFLISGFAGIESSWTPNAEEFSSLDISLGIKTSYLLSNKLAVSLGANYRADTYTAGHTDYNAGEEFFEAGLVPMFTTADNDMLEISTGLFFTPSGAHNDGFLFSGQLISNIMLKENYNYNFEDATHNFESSWIGSNNTLFSNLELGVGYRRKLKNGHSADLSPYIKIPVNGIGHGKLKLSSFGLRMAINLGL